MKVTNIGSNMTEIRCGGYTILVSYETPVAAFDSNGFYKTSKYHSNTTSKHINKWLDGVEGVQERPQEFFDNLLEGQNG
jgi:hypothetical protein